MTQPHEPQWLSVQQVLSDGVYAIPAYQRNYAWGVTEISQLMQDVGDYARREVRHDYYIGTLVVYARQGDPQPHWEVVDGQQRLTTLSLLVSVLRGMHPELQPLVPRMPLQFECREASSHALQAVFARPLQPGEEAMAEGQTAAGATEDARGAGSIWAGRAVIADFLSGMAPAERLAWGRFLLERVQLLRVPLPARTDLNHYFECMNNRGEQLAQHEVLKARLLGVLQQGGRQAAMRMLHAVWDACAAMERSVQAGFAAALRRRLFSADGRTLAVQCLEALLDCFQAQEQPGAECQSLTQLLGTYNSSGPGTGPRPRSPAVTAQAEDGDEALAQFGPVINFPNFLLQVLAMVPGSAFAQTPLDDKQLLTAFEPLLDGGAEGVEDFAFRLLHCRFLLDQHVIKRGLDSQEDEEHWQLQRCRFRNDRATLQWVGAWEDGGDGLPQRLRMLQAALHVSFMLPARKHWLQGALRWLGRQPVHEPIDPAAFLQALEDIAKAFVLEVGASAGPSVGYDEVVRRAPRFFTPQDRDGDLLQALPGKLVYGRARPIDFNFLDYLLWRNARDQGMAQVPPWRDFAFTSSRRSVEHLHPQTALFEGDAWEDGPLHAFGNLCLVSHAMNSRLGNAGAQNKFNQLVRGRYSPSLKILDMHRCCEAAHGWSPDGAMACHAAHVLDLLAQAFTPPPQA